MDEALRASYRFCGALARREARNFYYSFLLLPAERRRSMCALYAFLRHTDDLADEPGTVALKQEALEDWRCALGRALDGRPDAWPGLPALADAVHRHAIPPRYLHEVIDGVMMDLHPRHYERFEDLYAYCYLVASAVGLSCLHIWGFASHGGRAEALAEACGIALQLTNILRDVHEDARNGRIYLPRDDMDRFGVTPEALSKPVTGAELRALLEFEARRAEGYYTQADALVGLVVPIGRPVLLAIVGIYHALLDEIAARGYDVMPRRVALSPLRKAAIAWRSLAFRCLCVDSTALEGPRC